MNIVVLAKIGESSLEVIKLCQNRQEAIQAKDELKQQLEERFQKQHKGEYLIFPALYFKL